MVMTTRAAALLATPSLTTRLNTRSRCACTEGAVKVGWADVALDSATDGPLTCVHAYDNAVPSASLLALPSSVTVVPDTAEAAAPAFAVGARFTLRSVTVTSWVASTVPSD